VKSEEFDVVIIGAGAAGLAAAMRLSAAGRKVLIVEARNRVGGRILTVEAEGHSVELGAEFVHGKAPEIFDLVERYGLKAFEVDGDQFCELNGRLAECDFFEEVNSVFEKMMKYGGPDISFDEFLKSVCEDESTRRWARSYVAGFHGAPPDDAGVKALIEDAKAEEEIDGQRSWRIEGGYRKLIECMRQECERNGVELRLNTAVERVAWGDGASVFAGEDEFVAATAIVTIPVRLLQIEAIRFEPELTAKKAALDGIAMGDVVRCVLTFRTRWWEDLKSADGKSLKDVSFLFSHVEDFPTWWTQNPAKVPSLVGWASAVTAPGLTGKSSEEVTSRAVKALSAVIGVDESGIRGELVCGQWHDWCADPFTRGAYTYARVGGSGAYVELAVPIADTLYFAGEATDATGNHATVHGAIASGYRAADEVLSSRKL
jgi:monoamine oxidase